MMNREWLEKDYYQLLGVSKDASGDQIKKAYRKLAQKLHPDANPDDPKAVERFKEASAAYAVLSDDERRQEYDQVREMGAGGYANAGGGFGNFGGRRVRVEDIMGQGGVFDFGGFRNFGERATSRQGEDITAHVELPFAEAVRGTTTSVRVRGDVACSRCRGRRAEPGTSVDVCPTCGGDGIVAVNQGVFSFQQPCPNCQGSGQNIASPCTACQGSGRQTRTRNIKVKIPPGVKNGGTVRVPGKGSPGPPRGKPGDLLVKVTVRPHPIFTRRGKNLHVKLSVPFTTAALGGQMEVPTLNGQTKIRIPAGTSSGKVFKVPKKGVPRRRGSPGDLLVTAEITVPAKLPKEAKKALEEIRDQFGI